MLVGRALSCLVMYRRREVEPKACQSGHGTTACKADLMDSKSARTRPVWLKLRTKAVCLGSVKPAGGGSMKVGEPEIQPVSVRVQQSRPPPVSLGEK